MLIRPYRWYQQQQQQHQRHKNELQHYQQLAPFGRLTLDAEGFIHDYNSLFRQWVTSYQLPVANPHPALVAIFHPH